MLTAVNFNYKLSIQTYKINDILSYWLLPAKFTVFKLPTA